jgi:hypothetical protein
MILTPEQLRARIRQRLGQQRELVVELLAQRAQVQGSLFARYGSCGKAGCACRSGQRHGPYYVLSTRSRGQGGFAYLDAGKALQARRLVRAHRDFRRGMRRLGRLNLELVALLRRYQELRTRQGGRRLGLSGMVDRGRAKHAH